MTYQRGSDRWSARLAEADVIAIRQRAARGERLRDIAPLYPQVSKVSVYNAMASKKWAHLPPVSAYAPSPTSSPAVHAALCGGLLGGDAHNVTAGFVGEQA